MQGASQSIENFFTWLIAGLSDENAFYFAFVSYVAMILFERFLYLFIHRGEWDEGDALSNIGVSSISAIVSALALGAVFVGLYTFIYQFRLFDMPITLWWGWALTFAVHEFCYYLDHRLAHRIGFFWAFHQVHHASNRMNLTVASRGSIFDGTVQWTYWVIAPLLGIPLLQLLIVRFFTNLWGIFNHTRLVKRMGFLEGILATPANHRVHHGRQPKYLDRNYGQVTVIYDRLFGSWQPEEEEPDYGLVKRLESNNPLRHHVVGFVWLWRQMQRSSRWVDKLKYLWKPPGWSHDGQHETTKELQSVQKISV